MVKRARIKSVDELIDIDGCCSDRIKVFHQIANEELFVDISKQIKVAAKCSFCFKPKSSTYFYGESIDGSNSGKIPIELIDIDEGIYEG